MAVSDVSSLSVGKEVQWEKLIAKAASIRDICRINMVQICWQLFLKC
ncbi:FOCAD isoform 8 [Pan troglodytes]|uniref:FOCAD isoform 8 n=1 Tax=Pan troglodytes TaxID=9598 RepID=A0A2J8QSH0_PANTR|nr:FOCAD isoform 8 [Pan troglodytes]